MYFTSFIRKRKLLIHFKMSFGFLSKIDTRGRGKRMWVRVPGTLTQRQALELM